MNRTFESDRKVAAKNAATTSEYVRGGEATKRQEDAPTLDGRFPQWRDVREWV